MSEIDIEPKSSRWSPMKTWSTVGMALPAIILVVTCLVSRHYIGHVPTNAAFWMLVGGIALATVAHIGAHIRDSLAVNQARVLAKLVQSDARLGRLEAEVSEYGDRREVSGQMVAAQVVNGNRTYGRPRLMPVDE